MADALVRRQMQMQHLGGGDAAAAAAQHQALVWEMGSNHSGVSNRSPHPALQVRAFSVLARLGLARGVGRSPRPAMRVKCARPNGPKRDVVFRDAPDFSHAGIRDAPAPSLHHAQQGIH